MFVSYNLYLCSFYVFKAIFTDNLDQDTRVANSCRSFYAAKTSAFETTTTATTTTTTTKKKHTKTREVLKLTFVKLLK